MKHSSWKGTSRTSLLGITLLLSLLLVGCTFRVNNLADRPDASPGDFRCEIAVSGGPDIIVEPNVGRCTLRAAVEEANAWAILRDTIEVPPGTYKLESPFNQGGGRLQVTEDVTIQGDSSKTTLINGNGLKGIFQVGENEGSESENDISVSFRDLTIQNGGSGAMRIERHTNVTISNSVIRDNTALFSGGGIVNSGILWIFNSTIRNNTATAAGAAASGGGGIRNFPSGDTHIIRSTIRANEAPWGAGISNSGDLDIINSTISGNKAHRSGGGIYNKGIVNISFSTITKNQANTDEIEDETDFGGGIRNLEDGRVNIANSILAGNTDHRISVSSIDGSIDPVGHFASPDCYSKTPFRFTSFRGNLVGILNENCDMRDIISGAPPNFFDMFGTFSDIATGSEPLDPKLDLLANNGGLTRTHALRFVGSDNHPSSSPAVDNGTGVTSSPLSPLADCPETDQRGFLRPVDGDNNGKAQCDIGAFELGAIPPPLEEVAVTASGSEAPPIPQNTLNRNLDTR